MNNEKHTLAMFVYMSKTWGANCTNTTHIYRTLSDYLQETPPGHGTVQPHLSLQSMPETPRISAIFSQHLSIELLAIALVNVQ